MNARNTELHKFWLYNGRSFSGHQLSSGLVTFYEALWTTVGLFVMTNRPLETFMIVHAHTWGNSPNRPAAVALRLKNITMIT